MIPQGANAQAREGEEDQIRAAYLYNFAKFVEWPSATFASADDPIHICVFGNDRLSDVLPQVISGKKANGRPVEARKLASINDSAACEVLFVGSRNKERIPEALSKLRKSAILTVSETDHFAALGSMINLAHKAGAIELEINPDIAEDAGLKISSRLLVVAQVVRSNKGAQP